MTILQTTNLSLEILQRQIQGLIQEIESTLSLVEKNAHSVRQGKKAEDTIRSAYEKVVRDMQADLDAVEQKLQGLNGKLSDKPKINDLANKDSVWKLQRAVVLYVNQEVYHQHSYTYTRDGRSFTDNAPESYGKDPAHHCVTRDNVFQGCLGVTHPLLHKDVAIKFLGFEYKGNDILRNGKPSFS